MCIFLDRNLSLSAPPPFSISFSMATKVLSLGFGVGTGVGIAYYVTDKVSIRTTTCVPSVTAMSPLPLHRPTRINIGPVQFHSHPDSEPFSPYACAVS